MHAIRHWVALESGDATVAWAHAAGAARAARQRLPPVPAVPGDDRRRGAGLVTSWVANNVWETNFPLAQGGEVRFDYAVASAGPGADGRALGIATADALTRPLVGVLGASAAGARRRASASSRHRASRSSCSRRRTAASRCTSSRMPTTRSPCGCRGASCGSIRATTSSCRSGDASLRPAPELPGGRRQVEHGLPPLPRGVLAIDGPAALPWERLLAALPVRRAVDVRDSLPAVGRGRAPHRRRGRRPGVPARLGRVELADLFGELPRVDGDAVVFGPGARARPARRALVRGRAQAARARRGAAWRGAERRPAAGDARNGAAAALRRLAAARPPQAGAPPSHRPLPRLQRPRPPRAPRRRRAPPNAGRRGAPAVPHAADVLSRPVGRAVAPRRARHRDGRAEPRVVVRADRARGLDPGRRPRGRLRAADGGRRRDDPRRRDRRALRPVVPDPLRLPRHARRRPPLDPVPPVARRTRARRSACRTHRTRPTT